MTDRVLQVVVVGRDAPVWLTAVVLQRALGPDRVLVTVLELPTRLLETDVYLAVPAIAQLHEIAGIDELKLAAATKGVPMVGQRFANWSRSSLAFVHGYDVGDASVVGMVPHWVKARGEGMRVAFEDFSLAAAVAKQGRVPVVRGSASGSAPVPGYQYDARSYAAAFKHLAIKRGVDHRSGRLAKVNRDGGIIRSVDWEGEETFAADLFIDASGVEAILMEPVAGRGWESWAEWLPCDRVISASAPALSPLPPFSHNSAFRFGWIGLHPLQNRTAVVGSFSDKHGDKRVLEELAALAGAPVTGDAVISNLSPGMRANPWRGNCVAVGASAVQVEPLDAAELHLLHVGIRNLVERISSGADAGTSAAGFNQAMKLEAESVRDFQAAHYRLNRRFDEPLWDEARNAVGPASLEAKLAAFRARGSIGLHSEGAFDHSNWSSILIGHGLIPDSYDAWVDTVPEAERQSLLQSRLRHIAETVTTSPTVEEYLSIGNVPGVGRQL